MLDLGRYLRRALLFLVVFPASSSAQTAPVIAGIVVTHDGRPITGVRVWGSPWKQCCPVQYENVATGTQGQFALVHFVPVVHFMKDGFQPMAIVVGSGSRQLHIMLDPVTDSLVLRQCEPAKRGEKQIGPGKKGLRFTVPKRAVRILGGKLDVDYVKYVIKPKKGEGWLELWFGPYAMSLTPDEKQFENSTQIRQRNIALPDGTIGVDSWGRFRSGKSWRQMAILREGARYTDASAADAQLFDSIIDSACFTPYSSK